MIFLLHIDTATDSGTVALAGDGIILASRMNNEMRNHAGSINNLINEVLSAVGITIGVLSGIIVCGGPGSYTGLRIGMATAKGLCYALGIPLFVHSRLTLLAFRAWQKRAENRAAQYISLITARDSEYFISNYNSDFACTITPRHIFDSQLPELLEKMDNTYIITDVSDNVFINMGFLGVQVDSTLFTDVESWAVYSLEQYKCDNNTNLATAEPFYLKQVYTHK